MTADFLDLLERLAGISGADMGRPWRWPDREGDDLEVRYVHWRIYETESRALVDAPPAGAEAAAIMDRVQSEFGDLRGLLAGQPDQVFDAAPGAGEWSVRQTLEHTLLVDRRYLMQTRHAIERRDGDPVYIQLPTELGSGERAGGARDWIERLAAARADFDAFGRALPPAVLTRPTRWVDYEVDVRFRLHRAAAHIAEHTIQVEKALQAIDQRPSEARQVVRRISAVRGAHERRTPIDQLAELDRAHHALVDTITATP